MPYAKSIDYFAGSACKKVETWQKNPRGFFASCMAGGAYIGLGIVLILNVGQQLDGPAQKLAMGLTFAIALILVVIAGADLFTGYAMYMPFAGLTGRVTGRQAATAMAVCWLGNLAGSILVASLFAIGGGNGLLSDEHSVLYKIAQAKMSAGPAALIARAILCNWLVCLALWMSARVDSDTARCIVIFWCLLAFIASGFEHSVANMTLLSLAYIGSGFDAASAHGTIYNLALVTFGNLLGGGALVAGTYWLADRGQFGSRTVAQ